MAEVSHISWTDSTFNPWIGCTKVSPACDGCYAEALMDLRYGRAKWGPGEERSRTAPSNWKQPRRWNKAAAASGQPHFVFCASLADVFDNEVDWTWRRDLFDLAAETPALTWLFLTKRIGNVERMTGKIGFWPVNAALGMTVVNQDEVDRDGDKFDRAKRVVNPAFAFWSVEPMLGPVRVGRHHVDWIITGGETDQGVHKARSQDAQWFRDLRDECAPRLIPYHHKQNGEFLDGVRVGKERAGRLLDGVIHDARPTRRYPGIPL